MRWAVVPLVALTACPALRSPEERARAALARSEAEGYQAELPGGGRVVVAPATSRWNAPTVAAGERGRIAVFAQLSTEGRMDGTPFSYLGTERVQVACDGEACRIEGDPAPRLSGVLAALRARRLALAAGGGLGAQGGVPEPAADEVRRAAQRPCAAWFIRVDRDEAVVGEADDRGVQHRLVLQGRDGRWVFTAGLP